MLKNEHGDRSVPTYAWISIQYSNFYYTLSTWNGLLWLCFCGLHKHLCFGLDFVLDEVSFEAGGHQLVVAIWHIIIEITTLLFTTGGHDCFGRRNKILEFKFTDTYSMKPRGHIQICIQGLSLLLALSPLFGEQLNALKSTKN